MSMRRGGRNRARQKVWPGADAKDLRQLKQTGYDAVIAATVVERRRPGRLPIDPAVKAAAIAEQQAKIDNAKLVEHIAMPDWDKRIVPLFMFRGAADKYRIRALQNVAYGMFLAEAETYGAATNLFPKDGLGHLCGIHANLQSSSLYGIFGRLRGSPEYTNSVSKAFTEYVEWVHPYPCVLTPVSLYSPRRGSHAWWRKDAPYAARVYIEPPGMLSYPYIRGTPRPEHEMLMQVHGLIPSRITGNLRADLCQDLFVAVLSGEIKIDQIPESIKGYAKKAREIAPNRWRDVPLEFVLDDEAKPLSRIPMHRHTPDFVGHLCNEIATHEEESNIPIAHWNRDNVIIRRDATQPRYNDIPIQEAREADADYAIRLFESGAPKEVIAKTIGRRRADEMFRTARVD